MASYRNRIGILLTTVALVIFEPIRSFATTPLPPVVCIGNVCQENTDTATAGAIKYYPGHYVWHISTMWGDDKLPGRVSGLLSFIDEVCKLPGFQGVQVNAGWAALEMDTQGVYTGTKVFNGVTIPIGFQWVDQAVNRLAACDKKFMLNLMQSPYGSRASSGFKEIAFPLYLYTDARFGPITDTPVGSRVDHRLRGIIYTTPESWSGSEVSTPILWEAPVMDALIQLQAAYGARYNSNPAFVMWAPQTNMSHSSDIAGLSNEGLKTQTIRMIKAGRAAWPNTELRLWIDYYGTDSQAKAVMDAAAESDWVIGGNDVIPKEDIQSDRVFNGEIFGNDLRGVLPWLSQVASPELCGKEGTFTPEQLFNHAMDGNSSKGILPMRPQYFSWTQSVSCTAQGSTYQWAGIKSFVESINGAISNGVDSIRRSPASVRARCPQGYRNGCM